MKKVFSMICALSLAMSTMLVSPMAEAAAFVEDNQPRIITDCTKVTTSGLATVDFYLDFGKYDFAKPFVSNSVWDEDEEDYIDSYSAKGVQMVQITLPTSQFKGLGSTPIAANDAVVFPGVNAGNNEAEGALKFWFSASSANDMFIATEKVKLCTVKAKVDASVYPDPETFNKNFEFVIDDQNSYVVTWTLNDKINKNQLEKKIYDLTDIGTIFGTPDEAIVTIAGATGKVGEAATATGKVWNDVKITAATKATSYKAVFTDTATNETKEVAISDIGEVNGDATFAVVLKLVEKAASAADILLDIICE